MQRAEEMAFLRTVQLGSIRAAARDLGLDASGVSRRITALERRLRTRLVDRSGKKTRVTEQGHIFFEGLREIIDQLESLEAEIGGESTHPTGLLRVTSAIDFGQQFLTAWLLEFRALHPSVEFDLILSSSFLDMPQSRIDVALRVGALPDSSLIARKLASVPRVLVAATSYLDRKGRPQTHRDLEGHDFVFFSSEHRNQPLDLIDPNGETVEAPRSSGVAINAVHSVVEAVSAGAGIHNGPLWAFADRIASGEVEMILPEYRLRTLPLHVLRPPSKVTPARVTAFSDFIAAKVCDVNGLET
ncbi:MAG: LysR family transcriptional regulator [Pseudomonadota bacterium]